MIEFFVRFLVGLVFDLLIAAFIVLILNVVGVPALAALGYWQVFGLLIVFSLMYSSATLAHEID